MKLSKLQKDTILDEMKKKHFNHKQSNGVDIYYNKAISEGIEIKGTDSINPFVMNDLERVYGYDQVGNETRAAVSIIEQILMEDAKEPVDKEQETPKQEVETKEAEIVPIDDTKKQLYGVVPEYLTDELVNKHPGTIPALISMQKTRPDAIIDMLDTSGKPLKKNGKVVKYVNTAYMTVALNLATLMNWSFEVKEIREKEINKQVHLAVLGTLVVETDQGKTIVKEQWGSQIMRAKMEYGDALKGATSDSLKKCASMLGIAADVYAGAV